MKENRKIYLLFSHKLTKEQEEELKKKWSCSQYIYLPEDLQKRWSNIRNDEKEEEIFKHYLSKNVTPKDFVLIQGEWGISYRMVNYTKEIGATALYSYSERKSTEYKENGYIVKTAIFKHICFLPYERGQKC